MSEKRAHIYVNPYLRAFFTIAVILGGVWVVRQYVIGSYRISTDSMEKAVREGDYVLVNRLQTDDNPGRGRVVLFYSPLLKDSIHPPLLISRCIALPGDTIEKIDSLYKINGKLVSLPTEVSTAKNYTLVVPRKDWPYRLDSTALLACKEAILREAGGKAVFRNGKLFLDGRESSFFFFKNNYYWFISDNPKESVDSRHLGFIPRNHVIGSVWFCWFSHSKEQFFKSIR